MSARYRGKRPVCVRPGPDFGQRRLRQFGRHRLPEKRQGAHQRRPRLPGCQRLAGISAAPSVIGDYVVAGGLDGTLYVLDRKTGALKWKYDTARKYTGANGVEGNGGSFDAASIIATHGLLIVNSGYGMFGQAGGNVLLAFKPKS